MSPLRATQVFTPGTFPQHTYVTREEEGLEQLLRDGLDTPGYIVSLSGPSKSGKTVLVERVVGSELLITVTGAGIVGPDQLWNRVLDWMAAPKSRTTSKSTERSVAAAGSVEGEVGIPAVAKGKGSAELAGSTSSSREEGQVYERGGMAQVVDEIAESDFVLLVDDFHYMSRPVQVEVGKQLKEGARLGLNIVTASVPHRADDVVRANPELRGRVVAVDLDFWEPSDLARIAEMGFEKLNVEVDDAATSRFAQEAAGSPQLMQSICLHTCFELDIREELEAREARVLDPDMTKRTLERTALSTDLRGVVHVLDSGPKTRGVERNEYRFGDSSTGDVYRCVLKAIASDPPRLSFDYEELVSRIRRVSAGDPPSTGTVLRTCGYMDKLAREQFPDQRYVDWDEEREIFDIPDPYLVFYLRWSGRLMEG